MFAVVDILTVLLYSTILFYRFSVLLNLHYCRIDVFVVDKAVKPCHLSWAGVCYLYPLMWTCFLFMRIRFQSVSLFYTEKINKIQFSRHNLLIEPYMRLQLTSDKNSRIDEMRIKVYILATRSPSRYWYLPILMILKRQYVGIGICQFYVPRSGSRRPNVWGSGYPHHTGCTPE